MRACVLGAIAAGGAGLPGRAGEPGWVARWLAGAGDASLLGWITVAGYAAAAWLCWRAAAEVRSRSAGIDGGALARREARVWRICAVVLAALGVNKQLDLQSALTAALRTLARQQGWYEARRGYQVLFVVLLAVSAAVAAAALAVHARGLSRAVKAAGAGVGVLGVFVLLRAGSFHHADVLLRYPLFSLKLSRVLELGGILVTALAAGWLLIRPDPPAGARQTPGPGTR